MPKLLPKGFDDFNGVEPGPSGYPQTWQIGMYQISGFKTNLPVKTQKPETPQAGVIVGTVVETVGGMSWNGIIVESEGVKYTIELDGNSGRVDTQVGDIEKIGNRVRVYYKQKRKLSGGEYFLNATSVIQVKSNK